VLAIETRGLAKTYAGPFARAGHDALKGVDLSVEQGSAFVPSAEDARAIRWIRSLGGERGEGPGRVGPDLRVPRLD